MIIACELGMTDGAHAPVNAGLLAVLRAAFPHEQVVFAGSEPHLQRVREQLSGPVAASIRWEPIVLPERSQGYSRQLWSEAWIMRRLFRALGSHQHRHLLLTSACPSTVMAAQLVAPMHSAGTLVQTVLHGDLTGVNGPRHRHPVRRFHEMRTALALFKRSEMRYLVLEEPVREALLRELPWLAGRVDVLEHPVAPNEEAAAAVQEPTPPIRFGFLGVANEAKGFQSFLNLAERVSTSVPGRAEFHLIGRLGPDMPSGAAMNALATGAGWERLDRTEFVRRVQNLHFVVLPHRADRYGMTSTGTLLDAIALHKPIVARRIPLFDNVFARFGDIGYQFRDDEQLVALVEQIATRSDPLRYRAQVSNIGHAHRSRTPEVLAGRFRQVCAAHHGANGTR